MKKIWQSSYSFHYPKMQTARANVMANLSSLNKLPNASVNSSCAQPHLPPPSWPPGISIFFALDGKIPGVGTLELSNPPGCGRKKRENVKSSVNTATFFIDRTVELYHFAICVSINAFLCNSVILIKTSRRDDTSLWFFSIVIKLLKLKLIVRC